MAKTNRREHGETAKSVGTFNKRNGLKRREEIHEEIDWTNSPFNPFARTDEDFDNEDDYYSNINPRHPDYGGD